MSISPSGHIALAELARRLDAAGVRWLLAGSAGRALIGHEAAPRDLDVEVDAVDMPAAAAALGVVPRPESGGGVSSLRATGAIAGVEVDLSADIAVEGPGGRLAPDFALQLEHAHRAELDGRTVLVAPVEETVARAMVRGDRERVARITDAAGNGPALRPAYVARRLSAAANAAR